MRDECKKCGEFESDHNEQWPIECQCKYKSCNIDSVLKEIEDNFAQLWEANK